MIDWNNLDFCEERDPIRPIHEIEGDLIRMISRDLHPQIWNLIEELKDSAWGGGVEEAMSWQQAFEQEPYAN